MDESSLCDRIIAVCEPRNQGLFSDLAHLSSAGIEPHMENMLADRINARLRALGLSARGAAVKAGLHPDAIRSIQRGKSLNPRSSNVAALARVLEVPLEYLTNAVREQPAPSTPSRRPTTPLAMVFVQGTLQGNVWRDSLEWPGTDWYALTVPGDRRWPGVERFALEVHGPSMDRLYPPGSILVCVRFAEIDRLPEPGDKVICLRRASSGGYEATVKEYQYDKGRHVLWPRSHDPEFQQPLILPSEQIPTVRTEAAALESTGAFGAGSAFPEIVIAALVTQSIRPE